MGGQFLREDIPPTTNAIACAKSQLSDTQQNPTSLTFSRNSVRSIFAGVISSTPPLSCFRINIPKRIRIFSRRLEFFVGFILHSLSCRYCADDCSACGDKVVDSPCRQSSMWHITDVTDTGCARHEHKKTEGNKTKDVSSVGAVKRSPSPTNFHSNNTDNLAPPRPASPPPPSLRKTVSVQNQITPNSSRDESEARG